MDIQRPLPDLQRAHSNSAPAALNASPISPPPESDPSPEDETCRICKSESTPSTPLFHPCKCSGSIKYVHQDCLMEWLERSQKKHCELCKTPFRFTKLYERDMPGKLPMGLFVKHMLLHGAGKVRTGLRALLVGVVWAVGLPWVLRCVWGVMFFVADGGWWVHSRDEPHPDLGAALDASHEAIRNRAQNPPNALYMTFGSMHTSPRVMYEPINAVYKLVMDQAHNNATFANISYHNVLRALFYPAAFDTYGLPTASRVNETLILDYPVRPPPMILPQHSDSILSGIPLLQNLTKNSSLNNLIITILEGQIITVVVVVCFILIFLIREWVVQQQPGINVGAGFDAQVPAPQERVEEAQQEVQRLMRMLEEANEANERNAREGRGWRREEREDGDGVELPVARRDTEDETQRVEWRAQEEEARENGMHFVHREGAAPNDRLPEVDDQPEGLDENGDLIPVIGSTNQPTTEYRLRGRPDEEKATVVHAKLLDHVRFIIPGMSGQVTHLMVQEDGIDGVLQYIDYEEEIHQKLTETLIKHNQKLLDDGHAPILTKEASKEHILEALVSQMVEDHQARDEEKVVRAFMSLELEAIIRLLDDQVAFGVMVSDLDGWDGPGSEEEKRKWVEDSLGHKHLADVPEHREDEEIEDETQMSERERAYRESVRARRESHGSSVYDESEEEDPYSASRPDGGLLPERRRYEAKLAQRLQNGEKRAGEEGHPRTTVPFKFNFESDDIDAEHTQEQSMTITDAAVPAPREDQRPESQPPTVGGLITPPTPIDEDIDETRVVSPTQAAQGIVGYTMSGRPMISDEEMMRRLNADDDSWQGDNDATVFTQDTEDSGIATELRTPEEIAETERLEAAAEAARFEAARPQTLAGKLAFWLWGNAEAEEDAGVDDEHIVDDLAAEAPFVPVNHGHHEHHDHHHNHPHDHLEDDDQDNEVGVEEPPLQQALAGFADDLDNMDPEAIDEAEDFDGIMELVGMRGPVFTLLQNCLIGIILLTITIFVGIWIPYITGKVTLLMVAHPVSTVKLPLRAVFKVISWVQDLLMIAFGGCYYTFIKAISFVMTAFGKNDFLAEKNSGIVGLGAVDVVLYAGSAVDRIIGDFISFFAPDAENLPTFSAASHASLLYLKALVGSMFDFSSWIESVRSTIAENGINTALLMALSYAWSLASTAFLASSKWFIHLPALLGCPDTWVITLSSPARQQSLDLALSHWNAIDRTYATITGYLTFISLGAAYVSKGSPFSTSTTGKEWEALAIDILNQASGVLKVILIISIEMLVFPLYCGLLLDVATLPLFEGATLMSRITFGLNSPFTSMFVHWFVGTCYMFHFALFVSMCRKILRRGTLYFIRDPDDPTFHPVRDVLERNIATQLRKIGFSALVYGALVLVCLGGVVWSLSFTFQGVLPIKWSSNEPVLEFPIDLLFYNFLMPLAVRYFKPSKGLHEMYRWWFVQSAHYLRLSHFLLGDRRLEEELWAAPTNTGTQHLEDMEDEELKDIIESQAKTPPNAPLPTGPEVAKKEEAEKVWINKGRYVRAPASDMVRIPKSKSVFLEVNSRNERLDGKSEASDDLHGKHKLEKKEIEMVYHPPKFWRRVIAFIGALWMFAAVTGCSATLIPLVVGRRIFTYVLPAEVERNDVYAFAMGANLLFGTLYLAYYSRGIIPRTYNALMAANPISTLRTTARTAFKFAKLAATYFAFLAVIPALLAMMMEAYVIMPLHSWVISGEQHTVHFIQSWTLGLLMTNLARRWVLSEEYGFGQSRAAVALRRVVRRGYGDLDVQLAWREFVLPIVLLSSIALAAPMLGATIAVKLGMLEESVKVYRNAYPCVMALALVVVGMMSAVNKLKQWRMSIRDEVYLIGERLHNYTDKGKGRERRRIGQRRIET